MNQCLIPLFLVLTLQGYEANNGTHFQDIIVQIKSMQDNINKSLTIISKHYTKPTLPPLMDPKNHERIQTLHTTELPLMKISDNARNLTNTTSATPIENNSTTPHPFSTPSALVTLTTRRENERNIEDITTDPEIFKISQRVPDTPTDEGAPFGINDADEFRRAMEIGRKFFKTNGKFPGIKASDLRTFVKNRSDNLTDAERVMRNKMKLAIAIRGLMDQRTALRRTEIIRSAMSENSGNSEPGVKSVTEYLKGLDLHDLPDASQTISNIPKYPKDDRQQQNNMEQGPEGKEMKEPILIRLPEEDKLTMAPLQALLDKMSVGGSPAAVAPKMPPETTVPISHQGPISAVQKQTSSIQQQSQVPEIPIINSQAQPTMTSSQASIPLHQPQQQQVPPKIQQNQPSISEPKQEVTVPQAQPALPPVRRRIRSMSNRVKQMLGPVGAPSLRGPPSIGYPNFNPAYPTWHAGAPKSPPTTPPYGPQPPPPMDNPPYPARYPTSQDETHQQYPGGPQDELPGRFDDFENNDRRQEQDYGSRADTGHSRSDEYPPRDQEYPGPDPDSFQQRGNADRKGYQSREEIDDAPGDDDPDGREQPRTKSGVLVPLPHHQPYVPLSERFLLSDRGKEPATKPYFSRAPHHPRVKYVPDSAVAAERFGLEWGRRDFFGALPPHQGLLPMGKLKG